MTIQLVRRTPRPLFVVAAILIVCSPAHGAIEPRSILKTFFETGDVPTADQFGNLIDSFIHKTDDGLELVGIGSVPNGSSSRGALRVGGNIGINELIPDTYSGTWAPYPPTPGSHHPQMCTMFCGTTGGFLPLKYAGPDGPHYGFLQADMATDPGTAIFVYQWAWETTANTTITTFAVPEPTTAALLLCGLPLALRRRR